MSLRTGSPAIGLVLALGTVAGCGSEEVFTLELGANERLIENAAAARLSNPDRGLEVPIIVGDLDGDGIDDAIIRSSFTAPGAGGTTVWGGALYVLYGGSHVTGSVDLASLPVLIHLGWPTISTPPNPTVAPVGDLDGDGLADFVVTSGFPLNCDIPQNKLDGDSAPGAWVVYGSATRLTGSHEIKDAAALLSDPVKCYLRNSASALGDIDGDGKADFAINRDSLGAGDPPKILVYYGGHRLSGTVDLTATADAILSAPGTLGDVRAYRVGDVDGDGLGDFVVRTAVTNLMPPPRIVLGSATRLAGTLALPDLGHTQLPNDDLGTCFYGFEGFATALGDLDGDGADDFALVECQPGAHTVFGTVTHRVYYGRKGGLPAQLGKTDGAATIDVPGAFYPTQLLASDLDGDGIRDLIVADENLHDNNGGVHVIKGRHERLSGAIAFSGPTVPTYVGQPQRVPHCSKAPCALPEKLGSGVTVGDLTGDHQPDLLIGADSDDYEIVPGPGTAMAHTYIVSSPVIPKP